MSVAHECVSGQVVECGSEPVPFLSRWTTSAPDEGIERPTPQELVEMRADFARMDEDDMATLDSCRNAAAVFKTRYGVERATVERSAWASSAEFSGAAWVVILTRGPSQGYGKSESGTDDAAALAFADLLAVEAGKVVAA